ncbi:MAG: hypothetical protein N2509_01990 [Treponemataceae bacterium]|nr:hypothetical protein [Treponemataceae bacterium]
MKNRWLAVLLLVVNAVFLFADDKSTYLQLLQANKMQELKAHLEQWEKKSPDDPEMLIGYFNYYIKMASKEALVFGGETPPVRGTAMIITDPATGEKVGYLYGEVFYDRVNTEKALQVINKAIELYPDRLDMHFGKTRFLSLLKAYNEQKDYLLTLFAVGKNNDHQWKWSDGQVLENGKAFFVETLQTYIAEWMDSGNNVAFKCVQPVSEALIEYFPQSPIGYNDCGLYYAMSGDLQNAERYFLAGYQVAPSDDVILSNLACLYEITQDIEKAKKFYTLMARSSDRDAAAYAKQKLSELDR